MTERKNGFGVDVIRFLIPHRRPLLLVDSVLSWTLEPTARLRASRLVSGAEPVFDGHFPGWSLWPGVYTIEGMGHSCMLLAVLKRIVQAAEGDGGFQRVSDALHELGRGFRLEPGYRPRSAEEVHALIGDPASRVGMASNVDIKLMAPVFAGQQLDYDVSITHDVGHVMRFDVSASVGRRRVATGTIGSAFDVAASALPRVV